MIWHPVTTTLHVYLSWKTVKLLWLPIRKRIKYKVACMCFNTTNGSGRAYFSELLHVYTPSRTPGSFSDTRMLKMQQLMAFALYLALDPTFGKHDGNLSRGKKKKIFFFFFFCPFSEPTISQISSGITELSSRLDDCIAKLGIQNCLQTRH